MSAPARLLSVRLQGFKSFADRTHVEFGPGISAIVGPNGSGKSNLADALRWALGEQGRALRTRKSEDVVWAGSEKRPAVGMADVQLTLDNGDGLLPVDYGVVELGRRLYRSGENDYLLNRQRVRLKDLVDLLDAGHLAENAFLFIGQGMVDQALALRPEERRPLFEDVAGVRRHERRRRRAEEQLVESEANLARVDDILAELRPQAKRLAQQAEQQASRRTAADDLAAAILAAAHARWHAAGSRATETAGALAAARTRVDAAMAELLEHERAIATASAALDGQAVAEAAARATLERARGEHAALQLRDGRHASELDAARRERAGLEESRVAAAADVGAARQTLALPMAEPATELEVELAAVDAEIAATAAGEEQVPGVSSVDAAAIRRLEAARAQESGAARRRADEAERAAADEVARATAGAERAAASARDREAAEVARTTAAAAELASRVARESAQEALAGAESRARAATDRLAGARAAVAAATARHEEAVRALEAADGAAFSRAARARGGRSIADGLIIETSLQRAVDAALAGIGRAQVLSRADIGKVTADRGVAVTSEALKASDGEVATAAGQRVVEAARALGGGPLVEAVRRDDTGAVTRLLARVVWAPEAAACLELQSALPAGWQAVARDGSI
ncbi:MAG: AAA family ATPase, partial [Chloroflexota bacterium]